MTENVDVKMTVDTGQATQSTNNYKKTLKELKDQMVELQMSTNGLTEATEEQRAQYAALEQQAGQISDALGDVSARVKANADDFQGMSAALDGLKGGIGILQGVVGATELLGINNTGVEKAVKTMMGLQSVMSSINAVQQVFNKDSKLMIALQKLKIAGAKNEAVAMQGAAVATTAEAGATSTATVATRSFTAALMSNPFGLIAVAIATVTTAIIGLTGAMDDNTSSVESNTNATDKNTTSWTNNAAARREALKGYASLLSDIESQGVSRLDKEGALLEFVTGKLGVQVNSVEEARKVYEDFKKATDGITQSMEVFYNEGTQIHKEFTHLKDAALSHANALKMLKDAQEDYKEAAELGASQEVLDDLDEEIQKWEANSRYAEQFLKILEQNTVGYYKTLRKEREKSKGDSEDEVVNIQTVATETEKAYDYIGEVSRRVNDEVYADEEKTYEGKIKHLKDAMRLEEEAFEQEVADMKAMNIYSEEEYQTWYDLRETQLSQHLENLQEQIDEANREQEEKEAEHQRKLVEEQEKADADRTQLTLNRIEAVGALMQQASNFVSALEEAELAEYEGNEKKQKEIKKKYATAKALTDIAQIGVQTALGIMSVWPAAMQLGGIAGPILGGILTALIAGTGIAQTIKATKEAAKIKQAKYGAFVVGPSHSEGGVQYELEGGEAVLNKRAMAIPEYRAMASAMNVSTGGAAFPNTRASNAAITASIDDSVIDRIVNKIAAIPVVVSEGDITSSIRNVSVLEGHSRI